MTVQATTPRNQYSCTGLTTYIYSFKIFDDADLGVTKTDADGNETTLTLTTDYSVTGAGSESGGTIETVATYSDGSIDIRRVLDFTQETEFTDAGPLPAENLEEGLDRTVMLCQQMAVDVETGLATTNWKGTWVTAYAYYTQDVIQDLGTNNLYVCVESHTAGTWSTDLAAGKWQ